MTNTNNDGVDLNDLIREKNGFINDLTNENYRLKQEVCDTENRYHGSVVKHLEDTLAKRNRLISELREKHAGDDNEITRLRRQLRQEKCGWECSRDKEDLKNKLENSEKIIRGLQNAHCSNKCDILLKRHTEYLKTINEFLTHVVPNEIYKLNLYNIHVSEQVKIGVAKHNIMNLVDFVVRLDNENKKILNKTVF
jgi:hypothetical protein